MRILITESASLISSGDLSLDDFNNLGEVKIYKNISRSDLLKEAEKSDVILCNKALINKEVIDNAPNLKYIGTFATGYNNIDISAARERSITVCNAAGYSTNAVVQQVIGYILLHYTKIPQYNEFVKTDGWKKSEIFSPLVFPTEEVFGKTLGIIGFGNIGKAVKKAAEGLGIKVIVNTRTVREDKNTEFVSLQELLKNSDIVSLHCPLNEQSADMMNDETFNMMKDGAFFINTSRGGVVCEEALLKALKSGKLSGAAVDVLKQEPMSNTCVLSGAPNLIITPHTAWAPLATRKRLVSLVYDNLERFLNNGQVDNLAK